MGLFARRRAWAEWSGHRPRPLRRGFIAGLAAGTVAVAVLGVGLASGWLAQPRAAARDSAPAPVLVVFDGHGEDGARVAAFTFLIQPDGHAVLIDPAEQVSIPGASATTVREAAAFGGPRGLAEALGMRSSGHWAEFAEVSWLAALARHAPLAVDLTQPIDTYDGSRLRSFDAGRQTVKPDDIGLLADGANYLGDRDRTALLEGLARTVIAAQAATGSPTATATDMSPDALVRALRAASADGSDLQLETLRGGVR